MKIENVFFTQFYRLVMTDTLAGRRPYEGCDPPLVWMAQVQITRYKASNSEGSTPEDRAEQTNALTQAMKNLMDELEKAFIAGSKGGSHGAPAF